jgi:autotransporter-associated beta strand protein
MTINSVIADNTSASSVTKDGSGKLFFPITNTNTFSGGMVINAGTVENVSTNTMGTGAITIAGSATLIPVRTDSGVGRVLSNSLAVNSGATLTINNGTQYYDIGFAGVVSGNGTIAYGGGNNGNDGYSIGLLNAANTFTGTIDCLAGSVNTVCLVNSLPDSSNPIRLNSGVLTLNSGVAAPLVFNGRNITLSGTGNGTIYNNNATATNTITINTDLLVTGVGNKTLTLGGANTGSNTFAGRIPDGTGAVISLTKADAGTWVLTGTNTYSGATTISAGALSINSLANVNGGASALGNPSSTANGTLSLNGVTLQYTGSGHTSDRVVNLSGTTAGAVLDASGTGPLVLTSALTATGVGSKTLTLAGSSTATNTLAGAIVDNGGANKTSLIKTNAGTWVLAGSNTYTGTTTIRGGTLTGVTGGSCLGSSLTVTNTPGNTSAVGVTVNDNTKQWSCANLSFTTNGLGSQLQFSFAVAPSTSLAPLSVTNSLTFTGAPVVVVNLANVPPGIYPLVVVGGATAPTVVPALELMGSATKGGSLAWGGTGNKTLYLTVSSKATVITFR